MSEKSPTSGAASAVPKKKKSRVKSTHPPTSQMVLKAISSLNERNGSSLQAIKKYIAANYQVDSERMSPLIKKYLKGAVLGRVLLRMKGQGATGSFKINDGGKTAKSVAVKKKAVPTKKKAVAVKKVVVKKVAAKRTPLKKQAKSIAKKRAKSPVAKPKSPKTKRAVGNRGKNLARGKA